MVRFYRIAALCALFVTGCAGEPPFTGLTLRGGTQAQRQIVADALARLGPLLNRPVRVTFRDTLSALPDAVGQACVGCRQCDIEIRTDMTSIELLTEIAVHEYGHCAGLGHDTSNALDIMYPRAHAFSDTPKPLLDAFVARVRAAEDL